MSQIKRLKKIRFSFYKDENRKVLFPLLLQAKLVIGTSSPIACTTKDEVEFNPHFLSRATDEEISFVMAHEAVHRYFCHLDSRYFKGNINMKVMRLAKEYAVNQFLVDYLGFNVSSVREEFAPVQDDRYKGLSTMEIYKILLKESEPKFPDNLNTCPLEASLEAIAEATGQSPEEVLAGISSAKVIGVSMSSNLRKKLLEKEIPVIDWKDILRRKLSAKVLSNKKYSYRRPERRSLSVNVIKPSLMWEDVPKILAFVDVSGSISDGDFSDFIYTLEGVRSSFSLSSIEVRFWDWTCTQSPVVYKGLSDFKDMFLGGGGTEPCSILPVLEECFSSNDIVVILTDGFFNPQSESDWAKYNPLWVIKGTANNLPGKSDFIEIKGGK